MGASLSQLPSQPDRWHEKLLAVLEAVKSVASSLSTSRILEDILQTTLSVVDGADTGVIFLVDAEGHHLVPAVGTGLAWDYLRRIRLVAGEGMSGRAFSQGRPLLFATAEECAVALASVSEGNLHLYRQSVASALRSAISVPLVYHQRGLGVLSVQNYSSERQFTPADLRLVELIAPHAAIAIENARLFSKEREAVTQLTEVNVRFRQQNELLVRELEVHERLTQLMLQGADIQQVADTVAGLLGNPVLFQDGALQVLAQAGLPPEWEWSGPTQADSEPLRQARSSRRPHRYHCPAVQRPVVVLAASAGTGLLGYLTVVEDRSSLGELEQHTMERAAALFALELMKERAVYEAHKGLMSDLLDELVAPRVTAAALRRATFLGYDPTRPYLFLVVAPDHLDADQTPPGDANPAASPAHTLYTAVQGAVRHQSGVLLFPRAGTVAVLVPVPQGLSPAAAEETVLPLADAIQRRLTEVLGVASATIGIGGMAASAAVLGQSLREANVAVAIARRSGRAGTVAQHSQLGSLRLLAETEPDARAAFARGVLGPLLDPANGWLLETLATLVAHDRRAEETARALYVHANTLGYRLKRVERLTGRDLARSEDWLCIQLAIRIWQMDRLT